jgi:hypothetical protein
LPKDKECANISGVYVNGGKRAERQEYSVNLSELLYGDILEEKTVVEARSGKRIKLPYKVSVQVSTVIINQQQDVLKILCMDGERLVHEKSYLRDKDYKCTQEGIRIPLTGGGVSNAGFFIESGAFYFNKSLDGSLTVNRKSAGLGLFIVVPIIGSGNSWYKFSAKEMR